MKHIVFAIGSLFGGGAERVVSVWASALAEKGYRVSVLVYSRMENEYSISDKVNVYPIADSQEACNAMSTLKRVCAFRKILKQLKPNMIISFLPIMQIYMRIASFGLGIPRVETIRNNPWRVELLKTKFSKMWLGCFKSCKALIVQSEDQKEFFDNATQRKATIIPNPIDNAYVQNKKVNYDSNSHKIVAAGRLSEQKNYKMMIDAVSEVSKKYTDVTLDIYGVGELEQSLNDYIRELGIENVVKLKGRSSELYNVYKGVDLYLMTSDYEGMPNALAEAMAIGLPCISTDCKTGPRDLIDDGKNGYLVPCGDIKALAQKIELVFSMSEDENRTLGQQARKKIVEFCGEENSLNKLTSLIDKI